MDYLIPGEQLEALIDNNIVELTKVYNLTIPRIPIPSIHCFLDTRNISDIYTIEELEKDIIDVIMQSICEGIMVLGIDNQTSFYVNMIINSFFNILHYKSLTTYISSDIFDNEDSSFSKFLVSIIDDIVLLVRDYVNGDVSPQRDILDVEYTDCNNILYGYSPGGTITILKLEDKI